MGRIKQRWVEAVDKALPNHQQDFMTSNIKEQVWENLDGEKIPPTTIGRILKSMANEGKLTCKKGDKKKFQRIWIWTRTTL